MRPTLSFRFLRRRDVLKGGAVALAGCDRLVLPDGDPVDELDPITPNDAFYVTSSAGTPSVDAATWSLAVRDNGVLLGTIDWAFLDALPARDTERTLQCIGSSPGNQAISNAIWSGLPLPEVLDAAGITLRSDALQIVMTGADTGSSSPEGYRTALPRSDVDRPMWLVWRMNGEPLPPAHGFPARLLCPGRYGTKNVKWLVGIELVDEPFVGFWESRGWDDEAVYRASTFVRAPESETVVEGGAVIVGTAFAGEDEIASVEITTDGGATWEPAEITYGNGPGVWALWRFDWAAAPGEYRVQARCTTVSGATSRPESYGTDPTGGYDGSMAIDVTVL